MLAPKAFIPLLLLQARGQSNPGPLLPQRQREVQACRVLENQADVKDNTDYSSGLSIQLQLLFTQQCF